MSTSKSQITKIAFPSSLDDKLNIATIQPNLVEKYRKKMTESGHHKYHGVADASSKNWVKKYPKPTVQYQIMAESKSNGPLSVKISKQIPKHFYPIESPKNLSLRRYKTKDGSRVKKLKHKIKGYVNDIPMEFVVDIEKEKKQN